MTAIYVCSLARLEETVEKVKASRVATLIGSQTPVACPAGIHPDDHLLLQLDDISVPLEGMVLPNDEHVCQLLAFARSWDGRAPMVIHCWAGVSRSTAAAFAVYSALRPDLDEDVVADRIRKRSPEATPNRSIVTCADRQLRRDGRMVRAAERIGQGRHAYEGTVFALHLDE